MEEELVWMKAIASKMDIPGRTDLAYIALIAVLHSLRDKLDLQQIFQLSAYLPLKIRGIYFEGYDPEKVEVIIYNNKLLISYRNRMGPSNSRYFENYLNRNGTEKINGEELTETIREKLKPINGINPDRAFKAVIEVIFENIPYEDTNVNNIKNLVDLNMGFQTQS